MIRIEVYAETSRNLTDNSFSTYSIIGWCNKLKDVEDCILCFSELYKFNLKDIKKICIFIEGEENEKN